MRLAIDTSGVDQAMVVLDGRRVLAAEDWVRRRDDQPVLARLEALVKQAGGGADDLEAVAGARGLAPGFGSPSPWQRGWPTRGIFRSISSTACQSWLAGRTATPPRSPCATPVVPRCSPGVRASRWGGCRQLSSLAGFRIRPGLWPSRPGCWRPGLRPRLAWRSPRLNGGG